MNAIVVSSLLNTHLLGYDKAILYPFFIYLLCPEHPGHFCPGQATRGVLTKIGNDKGKASRGPTFASGFRADYQKWMAGYRVVVEGNRSYWVKKAAPSNTYQDFRRYLDIVFAYASTASLAKQMAPVEVPKMEIGDVFVDQGHAVIVVDMAENKESGAKLCLLAQSYMPAQDIQILQNPGDEDLSPWYELNLGERLRTPEWTFTKKDLHGFE